MSQDNVEVVKVAYEVFARAGLDRFMEHFTDERLHVGVLEGGSHPATVVFGSRRKRKPHRR